MTATCTACGAAVRPSAPCTACGEAPAGAAPPGEPTQRIAAFGVKAGNMQPRLAPMPAGLQVILEGTDGPARGLSFQVRQRVIVIGREAGEVRIADPMISRRHASLEVHDKATIILRDLSSTNGTLHNGQLIAFTRIEDGDEIRMGASVLTLSVDRA